MGAKGFSNIFLIIIVIVAVIAFIGFFNSGKENKSTVIQESNIQEISEPIKDEHDSLFKSFLNDSYDQFPKLKSEVSKDNIKNVFPLSLKGPQGQLSQGWIVEAKVGSENAPSNKYYLLTLNLEKELTDATSTVSDDKSGNCSLDTAKVVDTQDEQYLILASKSCNGYGVSGSGSVSVYKLPDGQKVKLQAQFSVPDVPSFWTATSPSGNALGIFKDAYGVKQPKIAVDYSNSNGVALTAYFDLKTGKLSQLMKFD
jgi:hypothetical protein